MRKKGVGLELYFLGTGNAFAQGRAYGSFLMDGRILFEVPPTALPTLRQDGFDLRRIDVVFISHFHADHCFGLPFLFLDHFFITKRKTPLTIVGPKGIERLAGDLVDLGFPGTRKSYGANFPVEFIEVVPGRSYSAKGIAFKAMRMFHGDQPDIGYRVEYKGRTIAYSGDTGPCRGLDKLLKGAHIGILEMSSLDGDFASHMNRQNIWDVLRSSGGATTLVLTHLPNLTQEEKDSITHNPFGVVEIAEDHQRLKLAL